MTPLKSSSMLKTVRVVELKEMVLHSLDSVRFFFLFSYENHD